MYVIQIVCLVIFSVFQPPPVIGEHQVNSNEAPYQVSVQVRNSHLCGGSIISSEFVLTASLCVNRSTTTLDVVSVKIGTLKPETSDGTRISVSKIIYHPEREIALLKLSSKINYKDSVKRIPLSTKWISSGVNPNITGWGSANWATIDEDVYNMVHDHLRIQNTKTFSYEDCKERLKKHPEVTLTVDHLCVEVDEKYGSTCVSDIGGPLVIDGEQIGVLYKSLDCIMTIIPDIYVRISEVREWISDTLKGNFTK